MELLIERHDDTPHDCDYGGGGLLKFGFGRDVPPQNLKLGPYKYQFFKKK